MLNCFYWYSIIWSIVLFLYDLGWSSFNQGMNIYLRLFLYFSITISFLVGYLNRKKFKNIVFENKKIKNKYLLILIVFVVLDFIYAKQIPLISIAFLKNAAYGEFTGIPSLHVFIVGFLNYFSCIYISNLFSYNNESKRNTIAKIVLISVIYLLYFYRALIIFQVVLIVLLEIYKLKEKSKIKFKHRLTFTLVIIISLFLYGGVGNIRDGYGFNDNSYIEKIGRYEYFPKILPKQYMWTYSYITTPLANLNYNVINNNNNHSFTGSVYSVLPDVISKRLFKEEYNNFILIRTYFNAVTGWCDLIINGGFVLTYLYFIFIIILTAISLKISGKPRNKRLKLPFLLTLCLMFSFMFFYNTFTYVATLFPFIIFLIQFCPKFRKEK